MKSVPPRGSGWVLGIADANCQLPIGCLNEIQLAIGSWQLAM